MDNIKNTIKNIISQNDYNISALQPGTLVVGANNELVEILSINDNVLSAICYTNSFSSIQGTEQYSYLNDEYHIAYPFICYWYYHISSIVNNNYVNNIRRVLVDEQNSNYQTLSGTCIIDSNNNLVFLSNTKSSSAIDLNNFNSICACSIAGCEQIKSCQISSSILTTASFIGSKATSISILIPDVYSFPKSCFSDCYDLSGIYINDAKSIVFDDYCFTKCHSLSALSFDVDDDFQVKEGAFEQCLNLISIDLSKCTEIGIDAFNACNQLSNTCTINANVVGRGAFEQCQNLQNILLTNNVYELHEKCFCGCIALQCINLPASISVLQNEAFYLCFGLTDLSIEASQFVCSEAFNISAFLNCCAINHIYVSNAINSNSNSFIDNICQKLSQLSVHPFYNKIQNFEIGNY